MPNIPALHESHRSEPGYYDLPECSPDELYRCFSCGGCRRCFVCRKYRPPSKGVLTTELCDRCRKKVRHGQSLTWA